MLVRAAVLRAALPHIREELRARGGVQSAWPALVTVLHL